LIGVIRLDNGKPLSAISCSDLTHSIEASVYLPGSLFPGEIFFSFFTLQNKGLSRRIKKFL
jgi:hypothetical protein